MNLVSRFAYSVRWLWSHSPRLSARGTLKVPWAACHCRSSSRRSSQDLGLDLVRRAFHSKPMDSRRSIRSVVRTFWSWVGARSPAGDLSPEAAAVPEASAMAASPPSVRSSAPSAAAASMALFFDLRPATQLPSWVSWGYFAGTFRSPSLSR